MSNTSTLANYALNTSQLNLYLESMIDSKTPTMIWGPPGCGKSMCVQQYAEKNGMKYADIRAVLLDPVDLRGIPYRDEKSRTRWAPPVFLPPEDTDEKWLINLEEPQLAPPMVQAALYQLLLDRKIGEYTLPESAIIVACGNREVDGGVYNRFSHALATRFRHIELVADPESWKQWGAANDIAPQVLFFITYRPDLLMDYDPRSREHTFPCPRTWEFVSDVVKKNGSIPADIERSIYVGIIGESAAAEFCAFLRCWRELPHPQTVIDDPENCEVPENTSSLLALCGSLYRLADDENFGSIVTFAKRLRVEIGEFLIWGAVQKDASLQYTNAYVSWAAEAA